MLRALPALPGASLEHSTRLSPARQEGVGWLALRQESQRDFSKDKAQPDRNEPQPDRWP